MLTRFRTAAIGGLIAALLASSPATARVDDEPLPRFEDAICPGIVGLKRDAAETVVGLIRANMETFGRQLADEDTCEPNVIVAFVDDGSAFLNNLADDNDVLFMHMDKQERDEVLAQTGSARAVLRVSTRTLTGFPIAYRESMSQLPFGLGNAAHSRIYTSARNDIVSALVLIDRGAVGGLTLVQLADYATFRALTHTLPGDDARSASVVSLFDGSSDRPAGLTDFDHAFLQTLYDGVPNLPGSARLAAMEKATGAMLPGEDQ